VRAFAGLVLAVCLACGLALVGLAASGATKSGVNALSVSAAATAAIDSITGARAVQVTTVIGAGGGGALPAGEALRITVEARAAQPGAEISAAGDAVDVAGRVTLNGTTLVQLRGVGGRLYAWVDLQAIGDDAAGTRLGRRTTLLAPQYGDRWYELPAVFGAGELFGGSAARGDQRVVDGVQQALEDTASFADAPSGPGSERVVVATGPGERWGATLRGLAQRLAAAGLPRAPRPGSHHGYVLRLTMSPGGELLAASLGTERAPGTLMATIRHDDVGVVAPVGASPAPLLGLRVLLLAGLS